MDMITQARPYAKAAFSVAKADNALSDWHALLAQAAQVAEDTRLQILLMDPNVSYQEKAKIFITCCGADNTPSHSNFLMLLAKNTRLNALPSIFLLFQRYLDTFEKKAVVKVRTARPIAKEQLNRLKAALKKRFNLDITLAIEEDPLLLAGAILEIDDKVIDGSIIGRLNQLTHQFEE